MTSKKRKIASGDVPSSDVKFLKQSDKQKRRRFEVLTNALRQFPVVLVELIHKYSFSFFEGYRQVSIEASYQQQFQATWKWYTSDTCSSLFAVDSYKNVVKKWRLDPKTGALILDTTLRCYCCSFFFASHVALYLTPSIKILYAVEYLSHTENYNITVWYDFESLHAKTQTVVLKDKDWVYQVEVDESFLYLRKHGKIHIHRNQEPWSLEHILFYEETIGETVRLCLDKKLLYIFHFVSNSKKEEVWADVYEKTSKSSSPIRKFFPLYNVRSGFSNVKILHGLMFVFYEHFIDFYPLEASGPDDLLQRLRIKYAYDGNGPVYFDGQTFLVSADSQRHILLVFDS